MQKLQIYGLLLIGLFLGACSEEENLIEEQEGYNWGNHIPFVVSYGTFSMPFTGAYESLPTSQGRVAISEASGIAYSNRNPGKLWTHNDSGNTNALFLIDESNGAVVATYHVSGTANLDWEDIEVSVDYTSGISYLYVSDTGDNDERRSSYTIYRFEEPFFEENNIGETIRVSDIDVDRIDFTYPDGSHDTEAMFVDPFTQDIFLATKRDAVSMLYVLPYPQIIGESADCYLAGEFGFREASAGTCSTDGQHVLIKNRQQIFYWERRVNETMVQMLERTPLKAPYAGEVQGEAICFDPELNYYTLSEQANSEDWPMLYKYSRQ